MFKLSIENTANLKQLEPSTLMDGMPVNVLIDGSYELYIWWEGDATPDDGNSTIRLDSPNELAGAFKKVFNRFTSVSSVPIVNPNQSEIGNYWIETSTLAVYLAASFVVDGLTQTRWVQLVNNAGGK